MEDVMEFNEYRELAIRTESRDMELIRERFRNGNLIRMLHAALGLSTEVAEFFESLEKNDSINMREELGDLFWYMAVAFDAAREEYGKAVLMPGAGVIWMGLNLEETQRALLQAVSEYVDIIKKTIFYDEHCLEVKTLESLLMRIYKLITWAVGVVGAGKPGAVFAENVEKLRKRYGEKFNTQGSLCRNVEDELSHLKCRGESDR
jgi:hypothetical protein